MVFDRSDGELSAWILIFRFIKIKRFKLSRYCERLQQALSYLRVSGMILCKCGTLTWQSLINPLIVNSGFTLCEANIHSFSCSALPALEGNLLCWLLTNYICLLIVAEQVRASVCVYVSILSIFQRKRCASSKHIGMGWGGWGGGRGGYTLTQICRMLALPSRCERSRITKCSCQQQMLQYGFYTRRLRECDSVETSCPIQSGQKNSGISIFRVGLLLVTFLPLASTKAARIPN